MDWKRIFVDLTFFVKMLQQILRDLYVTPEILTELDEVQKQSLFCKMREEQVRRWRVWDDECSKTPKNVITAPVKQKKKKSVSFMKGVDGEPWVWVMGEHEDDMSIGQIIQQEAIEKARQLAECEAEALRQQLIECITPNCEEDIYCSVDALQKKQIKPPTPAIVKSNYKIGHYQHQSNKYNVIDTNNVLNELNQRNATKMVAAKVAQWERRLTEERTCEILQNIQSKQLQAAKEAEEAEMKHEQLWKEQERKAKEAEQQIREIARKAREEHRLTTRNCETEPAYSSVVPGVPPGKQAVVDWFQKSEIPKRAGLDQLDQIQPYFHGLISRAEAECLLQNQPIGAFLVRLSEKLWGYAISYKTKDKCKHYLVSAANNYSFLGSNQVEHKSLGDLINYYKDCPLTGGEKLIQPCSRDDDSAVRELFAGKIG